MQGRTTAGYKQNPFVQPSNRTGSDLFHAVPEAVMVGIELIGFALTTSYILNTARIFWTYLRCKHVSIQNDMTRCLQFSGDMRPKLVVKSWGSKHRQQIRRAVEHGLRLHPGTCNMTGLSIRQTTGKSDFLTLNKVWLTSKWQAESWILRNRKNSYSITYNRFEMFIKCLQSKHVYVVL